MKILITGGAGFIGSHLAERLLADGHQVAIIDNLSTGSLDNIESFKDNANFHYTIGSILNRELLDKLMDGVDQVYHLAAAVGVKYIIENPLLSLKTNIVGTDNVFGTGKQAQGQGADHLHLGDLWQKRPSALQGRRRPPAGLHPHQPLGLFLQQGHRRVHGPGLFPGKNACRW